MNEEQQQYRDLFYQHVKTLGGPKTIKMSFLEVPPKIKEDDFDLPERRRQIITDKNELKVFLGHKPIHPGDLDIIAFIDALRMVRLNRKLNTHPVMMATVFNLFSDAQNYKPRTARTFLDPRLIKKTLAIALDDNEEQRAVEHLVNNYLERRNKRFHQEERYGETMNFLRKLSNLPDEYKPEKLIEAEREISSFFNINGGDPEEIKKLTKKTNAGNYLPLFHALHQERIDRTQS
ncbi:hypothetical protein HUU53_02735 [Candidatus Micrarchaeota archaeon]|nr:hypothetical protein [Candidatus Micrarchaeota archaeon]